MGGCERRVLKPDGTLWASGTHHIVFSLRFALQSLGGYRVINSLVWKKPNATPNTLHTSFAHARVTRKAVAISVFAGASPRYQESF